MDRIKSWSASLSKAVKKWLSDGNPKKDKKEGIKSINSESEEDYKGLTIRVPGRAHTTQCLSAGNAP